MKQLSLDDWIAREAIPFSINSSSTFNAAVDRVIASLGDFVELLGFGEALHGGKDILILRNRLFQHLVEVYGYSAIAIESSFPRAHIVNEYVSGRGLESLRMCRISDLATALAGSTQIGNSWSGCGDIMSILSIKSNFSSTASIARQR